MPRKKTDGLWVSLIKELAGEKKPRPSAAQIEIRLKKIADQEGRADCPQLRTIGRILEKEYDGMTDRQKEFYSEFRYPQAMVAELIPWEATRLALDVLTHYLRKHKARPSVQRVLWHWRLSMVNPDWEIGHRDVYATLVSAALASGRPITVSDSFDDVVFATLGVLSPQELDLFLMDEPWKHELQEARHYGWGTDDDEHLRTEEKL